MSDGGRLVSCHGWVEDDWYTHHVAGGSDHRLLGDENRWNHQVAGPGWLINPSFGWLMITGILTTSLDEDDWYAHQVAGWGWLIYVHTILLGDENRYIHHVAKWGGLMYSQHCWMRMTNILTIRHTHQVAGWGWLIYSPSLLVRITGILTMLPGEDDWQEERGQEAVDRKAGHPAESSTWRNKWFEEELSIWHYRTAG
jgi:hypothetical protein